MTDDLGATAPKYQRIADVLRRQIKAGEYQPGDRLPSETTLLERFRDQFGHAQPADAAAGDRRAPHRGPDRVPAGNRDLRQDRPAATAPVAQALRARASRRAAAHVPPRAPDHLRRAGNRARAHRRGHRLRARRPGGDPQAAAAGQGNRAAGRTRSELHARVDRRGHLPRKDRRRAQGAVLVRRRAKRQAVHPRHRPLDRPTGQRRGITAARTRARRITGPRDPHRGRRGRRDPGSLRIGVASGPDRHP